VLRMREDLDHARDRHQTKRVRRLSKAILAAQEQDAEFMYQVSLERMEAAQRDGLVNDATRYKRNAALARAALPQFQLEGLWVGRYGDSFQMVNVSYVGDLLVAHKITGTQRGFVPRGEVSFQVDLSPANDLTLDPIELKSEAAELWGSRYLQRHTGLGQVAGQGYIQSQWLEGQLILVNDQYFSFAWLPTGHQVFFGRPGPDLTLKLMRQQEASVQGQKNGNDHRRYLERCLEATDDLDDELETSDGLFRSHDQAVYFDQEGCFD
jgi:Cyclin D1 binding domain